jgi:hypothetical protein
MFFLKNNEKSKLAFFIFVAFLSHFIIYGLPTLACTIDNVCYHFHKNFYYFYISKTNYIKIYTETLFYYISIALIFYLALKTNFIFFKKLEIKNININQKYFLRTVNFIFLLYLILFFIINYEIFKNFEFFFKIHRYKYHPQSLTILWISGFVIANLNLILKNKLISILTMFVVIFFLYMDGSRLWVLLVFTIFILYFYIKFNFSLKLFLFALLSALLFFFLYINFMSDTQRRAYLPHQHKELPHQQKELPHQQKELPHQQKELPHEESKINSGINLNTREQQLLKCSESQIGLLTINLNPEEYKKISYCEDFKNNKNFIFAYLNKKLQIDGVFHVYIPYLYPSITKSSYFVSVIFNLGFITPIEFQKQNALADRIVKENNIKESASGLNLNMYAGFVEMFSSSVAKFFFIINIGLLTFLLCNLLSQFKIDKDSIEKFIIMHLFFFLSMGSTNSMRSSIKVLIFNLIFLMSILSIYYLITRFKLHRSTIYKK